MTISLRSRSTGRDRMRGVSRFRPDWEVAPGAALDYLASRGDVDQDRIAYAGYSMGGYFVPRTATTAGSPAASP